MKSRTSAEGAEALTDVADAGTPEVQLSADSKPFVFNAAAKPFVPKS